VKIAVGALQALERHGEEVFPRECCGLLLGRRTDAGRLAIRAARARNLEPARAHDRYLLDPQDRLRAEEEGRRDGLELVGFYHSHPDHEAYFSLTDLQRSEEYQWGEPWLPPSYTYLVTSVLAGRAVRTLAFEVQDGRAVEVRLEPLAEEDA
jgi:proteasome lid subunit RPN8/RPN11